MKENLLDYLIGDPNNELAMDKLLDIFLEEHPEILDDDQEERFEMWLTNELETRRNETQPNNS